VRFGSVTIPAEPTIYLPVAQSYGNRWSIVVAMRDNDPGRSITAIRSALREMDPSAAPEFGTLAGSVAPALTYQRLGMLSMSAFGVAALLLAMVGVFGVVAYGVAQRQNEMAIRVALGATGARLFWMVLGESGRTILAGTAIGVLASVWMGAALARYVYQVSAADVGVLIAGAAGVGVAAAFASCLPIRGLWKAAPRSMGPTG
jgi:putative ABC transport system permease protein